MLTNEKSTDKAAIGLSILYPVHCVMVPLLILFVPSVARLALLVIAIVLGENAGELVEKG
ncbi:hypothetical protein [Microbulbifer agarilyticus]